MINDIDPDYTVMTEESYLEDDITLLASPSKPVRTKAAQKTVSVTDWLVILFISMLPGINLLVLLYRSIFLPKTNIKRNFSIAYLIAAPFSFILTLALFALLVYFFGGTLLDIFAKQNPPKIW